MNKLIKFTNDDNVIIKVFDHKFTYPPGPSFVNRNSHEVCFRRINTYLIKNNIIKNNIIDLGAWIGDNSIPWAKNIDGIVYSIDPSINNIKFINDMCIHNDINNIITINKVISDKNELVFTNGDINHTSFNNKNGNIKLEAVSLDYLYNKNIINNIGYIHLDVEGFEYKIINGSIKIINDFNPIISYEQHIDEDDYYKLSKYLFELGYNIYIINEILKPGRYDCRNLLAIPKNINLDINEINNYVGKEVLLSIFNFNNNTFNSKYTATIYGKWFSNNYYNIKSLEINNNLFIFVIHDNNFTKFIAIDNNKEWIIGKFIRGKINLNDKDCLIYGYNSAQGIIKDKRYYNIKDIQDLNNVSKNISSLK